MSAVMTQPQSRVAWKLLGNCYLPDELLSLNKFTGGHWAGQTKHWRHTKEFWLPLLRSNAGFGEPVSHAEQLRVLHVERWLSPRQRKWDTENLTGGSVKCISDALVRLGWLKDDSPRWRHLYAYQVQRKDLAPAFALFYDERKIRTNIRIYGQHG